MPSEPESDFFERSKGITENELVVPTILILARPKFVEDGISITELHPLLRNLLKPAGHDLKIISGRSDDFFSQKVRNLVSHRKLDKLGLATYRKRWDQGRYYLTEKGRKFADEFMNQAGFTIDEMIPSQLVLPMTELKRQLRKLESNMEDNDWK